MKIGVAITTLNRRDTFNKTLAAYHKHTPPNFPLIVVDDGSDNPLPPHPHITQLIHNPKPKGVARAKNQCITALIDTGCDHLFLTDDDAYPTADNWWKPYVDSGEHHLSLQLRWTAFCRRCRRKTMHNYNTIRGLPTCGICQPAQHIYENDTIHAVQWGSGVLLYFTRHAINTIGGMRTEFGRYGGEHLDIAYRARNANLTRYPFQDVLNPHLHSIDAHSTGHRSCIPEKERREHNARGWQLFEKHQDSKDFVEYREPPPTTTATVCIPWRPQPNRLAAHDRATKYWADNGYPIIEADSNPNKPFLCSQARNNAAHQAPTDIVIIADADTIPDNITQIHDAITLIANNDTDIVWPFTTYKHIPGEWATQTRPLNQAPVQMKYPDSPGGIFIMRKQTLLDLGGFDERFTPGALGFDDTSFRIAADTLKRTTRIPGTVWSFNHAARPDGKPDRDFTPTNPNWSRHQLYLFAKNKPAIMRELIR